MINNLVRKKIYWEFKYEMALFPRLSGPILTIQNQTVKYRFQTYNMKKSLPWPVVKFRYLCLSKEFLNENNYSSSKILRKKY